MSKEVHYSKLSVPLALKYWQLSSFFCIYHLKRFWLLNKQMIVGHNSITSQITQSVIQCMEGYFQLTKHDQLSHLCRVLQSVVNVEIDSQAKISNSRKWRVHQAYNYKLIHRSHHFNLHICKSYYNSPI